MHAAAPCFHLGTADNFFYRPITTFDKRVRTCGEYAFNGGVFFKPGHQAYALKRSDHRHAILKRVDGAVIAFAKAPDRRVGIQRHDKGRTKGARFGKIGDVASMENVEYAIGECKFARQTRNSACQLTRGADFFFERRTHGVILRYARRRFRRHQTSGRLNFRIATRCRQPRNEFLTKAVEIRRRFERTVEQA